VPVGAARTADSAPTAKRALVVSPDSISRSERLRVAGERDVQLQSVVVTGSGASRLPSGANASRPATPAALAGCYRLQPAAGADVATLGDFVTLQTVELAFAAAGSDEARPAYVARDLAAADGATAGGAASLRWTLSTSGQVILVRGEGATLRRVPLRIAAPEGEARSAGAPAAGTMAAVRIDCPRR
jgi:hypothetical protein